MSGAVSPSGLNGPGERGPGDRGPDREGWRKEADLALERSAREGVVSAMGGTSSCVSSAATAVLDSGSGVGGALSSPVSSFFSEEGPALAFWDFFFIS